MLLSRTNKLFNKLMSNHRKGHIIRILDSFDKENANIGINVPIDLHVRKYFLKNREVVSIDREFINNQVCSLIRYRGLLDFLTRPPLNWMNKFDIFYSENFEKQLKNVNLPP